MPPEEHKKSKEDETKELEAIEQKQMKENAIRELEAIEQERKKKDIEKVDRVLMAKLFRLLLFIAFFPASALLLYTKLKDNGVEFNWSNMKNALFGMGIKDIVFGSLLWSIKKVMPKEIENFNWRDLDKKDIEKLKKNADKSFQKAYADLDKLERRYQGNQDVLDEIRQCREELKASQAKLDKEIEEHAKNFYDVGPSRAIGRPKSEEEVEAIQKLKPEHKKIKQELKETKRNFSDRLRVHGEIPQRQFNAPSRTTDNPNPGTSGMGMPQN